MGTFPELDALGQGQFRRVVDGYGLAAHVGFPGVGAGLPAAVLDGPDSSLLYRYHGESSTSHERKLELPAMMS